MPQTWNNEYLDQLRMVGDEPADKLVQQLVATEGEAAVSALFDRLIGETELPIEELPPQIQEFISTHGQLPEWIKSGKVAMAQDLFIDHGPKFLFFLYFKSLPMLYACANGAKVLAQTAKLAYKEPTAVFTRRIAGTGQFLLEVMAPGNLLPGAAGIRAALKARLVLAAIRYFTEKRGWDHKRHGKPVNQEDMAITLLTFSIALTDGLQQFGVKETRERERAFLHTWRGVGFLMGIAPEVMPTTIHEGRWLLEKILSREARKSEDGLALTQALLQFVRELLPPDRLKYTPEVLMHHMLGDELADTLEIKLPSGCLPRLMPGFLKARFRVVERLEDKEERFHELLESSAEATVQAMVTYFDQHMGKPLKINAELQEHWNL